jgi:hypothetical protein
MAKTLTPSIPRVHPTHKTQPNHGILSHCQPPFWRTQPLQSAPSTTSSWLKSPLIWSSHVEGVDCLLPIRAIRGVVWGDDVNHGHRCRRRPTVAYQQHAPTRHTSHGTTTGIVGGGKMDLMTTPSVTL